MMKTGLLLPAGKYVIIIVAMISFAPRTMGQSAAQLLKEGSKYQASDDISDRAPDLYRQLIRKYPKSAEAESAQFFLGAYYSRKFFILEQRSKVQDWGSMNRAEEELYSYIGKYPRGFYLADAYHTLAIIALRRDYRDNAKSLWNKMKDAAGKDRKVYIFRVTWSPSAEDVIKGYCDTVALARTSLDGITKDLSFNNIVKDLTNWARSNCH